jgi:hypothetical protein
MAGRKCWTCSVRPPSHLGRSGGRFASDGATSALYAGWGIAGRGNRAATAALFGAGRAMHSKIPTRNSKTGVRLEYGAHDHALRPRVPVDGPVAAAFGQGMYLAAAREAYSGKPSDRNRLLGSRLTTAGMRIDEAPAWPVLHESPHRIANPALAGGTVISCSFSSRTMRPAGARSGPKS